MIVSYHHGRAAPGSLYPGCIVRVLALAGLYQGRIVPGPWGAENQPQLDHVSYYNSLTAPALGLPILASAQAPAIATNLKIFKQKCMFNKYLI